MTRAMECYGVAIGGMLKARHYAKAKDLLPAVSNPFLCCLFATTPSTLLEALTSAEVRDGTLNRILLLYLDTAPKLRPLGDKQDVTIPDELAALIRRAAGLGREELEKTARRLHHANPHPGVPRTKSTPKSAASSSSSSSRARRPRRARHLPQRGSRRDPRRRGTRLPVVARLRERRPRRRRHRSRRGLHGPRPAASCPNAPPPGPSPSRAIASRPRSPSCATTSPTPRPSTPASASCSTPGNCRPRRSPTPTRLVENTAPADKQDEIRTLKLAGWFPKSALIRRAHTKGCGSDNLAIELRGLVEAELMAAHVVTWPTATKRWEKREFFRPLEADE